MIIKYNDNYVVQIEALSVDVLKMNVCYTAGAIYSFEELSLEV